jgi:hypothetical protein
MKIRHRVSQPLKITFPPAQEPDVTRILPSGAFSQTSLVLSVVASFSKTFSRFNREVEYGYVLLGLRK